MRSICLRCLESVLPMEKRNELWEQFNALDSDQKGYLNGGDVRRAIKPPSGMVGIITHTVAHTRRGGRPGQCRSASRMAGSMTTCRVR